MLDKLNVDITIPERLEPFHAIPKRFKVAYGGRGGAKSQSFTDLLILKSTVEQALVGCFREFQNSIDDSVYNLIKSEILRLSFPGWNIFKSYMDSDYGGGFRFKGLARSIEAIKSAFGFKYFWLEEGQFISQESLDILTKTLRLDDSEIWISANPMNSADPFSKRFIVPFQKELDKNGYYEDDLHLIVKINYMDNPWFPEALELERKHDREVLPRALYDHIWLGAFNDSVENAIILAEWFDECIDAHKKLKFEPLGLRVVSHDPSDSGFDDKGLVFRHGSVIENAKLLKVSDVNDGLDWALDEAINYRADFFTWDADGMGLGLKRQVSDYLKNESIDYAPFRGSEGVDDPAAAFTEDSRIVKDKSKQRTNKQALKNKRAQYFWNLKTRVYNTFLAVTRPEFRHFPAESLISFSSNIEEIDQLRSEICKIPRKPNPNGQIQIMNKQDMKMAKIESPNLADACMMALCIPTLKTKRTKIKFNNPWG